MAKQSNHSTELERLFRAARRDLPSAFEQRQLQGSVLAALSSGQNPPAELIDPPFGHHSGAVKLPLKLLTSFGVVAAVLVGVAQLRHRPSEVTLDATTSLTPLTPATPSEASQATLGMRSSVATPPVARASTTGSSTPSLDAPTAAPEPHAVASGSESGTPSPRAALRANTTSIVEPRVLTAQRTETTKGVPATGARVAPAKAVASEASLIEQARRELASSPSAALALTETHRKYYPKGILVQEREVIAIEALTRLGKTRSASRRADEFRNEQPHSIHEVRLRGVLGDAGVGK